VSRYKITSKYAYEVMPDGTERVVKGDDFRRWTVFSVAEMRRAAAETLLDHYDSEHPLARAIVVGAKARGIEPSVATDFESLAGRGARARGQGRGGPLRSELDQGGAAVG